MKILLILLMLLYTTTSAQYKNCNWIIGGKPMLINFKDTGVENKFFGNATQQFNAFDCGHSVIANDSILLACNGYFLFNRRGDLIENGDYIVPKKIVDYQNKTVAR